ncbi:MAG: ABC-2 family transporter protein [Gemmatimonadota bacterium]|jgi:ABC-2 type transport system permease protein
MSLRRYARVLGAFWRVNVALELQYRANFFASLLNTVFWLAMALLTAGIFFRQTNALGGWSFWQVVVLLGVFNAVAGVVEAVLRPNIGQLVQHVRRGSLDLILVKPVDAQFMVSFRHLVFWNVTDIVLGLGLSAYGLHRLHATPTLLEGVAFLIAVGAAVAIVYAVWLGLMTLAFWFVAVENLAVLFDALYETARFPVSAYPPMLRFLLVYLVPIAWITTVPAGMLTGHASLVRALEAAGVALLALGLTRLLWRTALSRYTSAGG